MKNYIKIFFVLLVFPFIAFSQEEVTEETVEQEVVKEKLERPAFESSYIIDNPTDVLFSKNALEVQMGHRFGLVNGGENDLAGFWAPSNIRIGLSYSIHERLTIGYGTTKFDRLQDFNWKVALLRQTQSNKMPVNVTYYGNFTVDARTKENFNYVQDRYSNFHQLIISRKFSPNLSLQVAPSVSHYNVVKNTMRNDMIAVAFGGRYKISPQTAILVDYTQPITKFLLDNPHPGVSVGVEFSTSAHAFQIFATNYNAIVPQKNIMFNGNDFLNGDFLIGFNITRVYNF
ncbi:DUF5777 family beta-barrel protein [Lutibacter sp.]|uniref:DUF5777 family beta-barrel protein n=1 Tax=Lutibacter sp. TaxID=1925666 RepID=UPI0027370460|nr:DUF5777 family beta-barrel protein [Lutibacter sp.]MDP3312404.1 DUF5777 family beta-barrel protein [Lutibacter sp.]